MIQRQVFLLVSFPDSTSDMCAFELYASILSDHDLLRCQTDDDDEENEEKFSDKGKL